LPSENDITLVVTSCGRYDLLARTLESLYLCNDYPFAGVLIAEDWERIGLVKSVDRAYSRVETPLVFHCEDDWLFYSGGFMEQSLEILEHNPTAIQVWLRAHNDTNHHPVIYPAAYPFPILDPNYNRGGEPIHEWGGFSWNPGLRRLDDWKKIGGYAKYQWPGENSADAERRISQLYRDLGYVAAILPDEAGYVKHIGAGRELPK
jgi:hypothetical protein